MNRWSFSNFVLAAINDSTSNDDNNNGGMHAREIDHRKGLR
jgi:hypothetical protein